MEMQFWADPIVLQKWNWFHYKSEIGFDKLIAAKGEGCRLHSDATA